MHTANPSYRTPYDEDLYDYDDEPLPLLAICYWQVEGPDDTRRYFDVVVLHSPEDLETTGTGWPYPRNESYFLIY